MTTTNGKMAYATTTRAMNEWFSSPLFPSLLRSPPSFSHSAQQPVEAARRGPRRQHSAQYLAPGSAAGSEHARTLARSLGSSISPGTYTACCTCHRSSPLGRRPYDESNVTPHPRARLASRRRPAHRPWPTGHQAPPAPAPASPSVASSRSSARLRASWTTSTGGKTAVMMALVTVVTISNPPVGRF